MKKNIMRFIILAAIGFGLGGAIAYFEMQKETPATVNTVQTAPAEVESVKKQEQTMQAATKLSGEFSLISENGSEITQENFRGLEKLVFFGFTNCPDICPATLTKLSTVLPDLDKNLPVLFITVDPKRDTPEVMGEYVDMFDKRIVGLTGSQEQVDAAINAFKVYAAKEEPKDMSADHSSHGAGHDDHMYMMQHSAYIYFMGKDNELLDVINSEDSAETITQEINAKL